MRKTTLLLLFLGMSVLAFGQEKPASDSTQTQVSGTLLWGLYTWGNWKKDRTNEEYKPKLESFEYIPVDTTRYDVKSILGGAVQWTRRKKKSADN